ncbi:hypothetical protein GWK08_01315 [Leptobacterium flavescens]|uniref:Uncharacterized protein n=1 Tax=Leptobacterium flavescens TaxID=472055 RepID=A0A6P0UGC6_9FLAO|nr:hypothetical protein [Leptobacterium flavescens]NER12067.1 hypothetical protein [Leptobacterium flavescens]
MKGKHLNPIPKLEKVSLNISSITVECYVWKPRKTSYFAGYIEFKGQYRIGSAGINDAKYIHWKINEFCDLTFPEPILGLIVDLTQLDYSYGDDLEIFPERLISRNLPIKVLVQTDSLGIFDKILDKNILTDSREVAFDQIENFLQKYNL